eukprot:COSAG05_NODE_10953_length_537_cov_1.584475_1_plen_73_part_10
MVTFLGDVLVDNGAVHGVVLRPPTGGVDAVEQPLKVRQLGHYLPGTVPLCRTHATNTHRPHSTHAPLSLRSMH